jgi:hypothetical protein
VRLDEMASHLSMLRAPWWVAGGRAIDLYLGTQSRPHEDLDIGVLRRDVIEVLSTLSSCEIFEAKDGLLTRLGRSAIPRTSVNSLWCRPIGNQDWTFELMLDDSEGDCWAFRRDTTIQMPLSLAIRRDAQGVPFLAPEIQLLYKARSVRAKDQADFDCVGPRLDSVARAWLRVALNRTDPYHQWLSSPYLASR